MKKLAALATTLILGLSSAAMADTSSYGAPETSSSFRDHRMPARDGFRRPPFHASWQTIASGERLVNGRDAVQLYTPVRASVLKLEATRGSTFVGNVSITFANGRTQIVELNQQLGRYAPLTIDLAGNSRMISRIVVSGRGSWRSSYNVLAA